MSVRFPGNGTNTLITAAVVTTAETVILTSAMINLSIDFAQVMIFWWYSITLAASTTSLTSLLRRGTSTSGTLINVNTSTAAAASTTVQRSGCYVDTPGAVAEQQYSVSVVCGAAGANATVVDGSIIVLVL